jgi:hypothetical protein
MFMLRQRNRLRTSCAPAVGRGDFKKLEPEDGAVQPITAAMRFGRSTALSQIALRYVENVAYAGNVIGNAP